MRDNGLAMIDWQLRYHFHIDPDTLSDTQWAEAVAALDRIRKEEAGKRD